MSKIFEVLMAMVMTLTLDACGSKEEPAPQPAPAPEQSQPAETPEAPEAPEEGGTIGVCIYKFDDAFMTTYRNALQEILEGKYNLDVEVDIAMQVDYKAIYKVGKGRLVHDNNGFHLTGCDGRLDVIQKPMAHYSLYADYYWYELGDVICIGDTDTHYFCFPPEDVSVAKIRLAAEEMYKLYKSRTLGK